MKRTIMIIIALLTLTLPVATMAYSSRNDDDDDRRNSRNRNDHSQLHRALAAEHRSYHQYNRINDYEDRIRHRRFHRYLEAKHRREHRNFCDDCWRWLSGIKHYNYNDDHYDRNDHRRNTWHDRH